MAGESGIFTPADVAFVQSGGVVHCLHSCFQSCSPRGVNASFGDVLAAIGSTYCTNSHVPLNLEFPIMLCWCAAGCGAILVGESIVKHGDPEVAVKTLLELH